MYIFLVFVLYLISNEQKASKVTLFYDVQELLKLTEEDQLNSPTGEQHRPDNWVGSLD